MATERTYMHLRGFVVTFTENREFMLHSVSVVSEQDITPIASGRVMSSLASHGGLAGLGGIAGIGGGLAG